VPAVPGGGAATGSPAEGFAAALATAVRAAPAPTQLVTLGQFLGTSPAPAPPVAGALGLRPALLGGVERALLSSAEGGPGAAVLEAATRYLGVPYRWGGTDPSVGLDCSGFVQRVYADLGISLPRVSVDQARQGVGVASLAEARPGDLVFWQGSPNHIGIYAGDGEMIVAPRTGDVVRFQRITRTPHAIRRIV
jgi:peptidoglycan DL-endopeptidase CwlO